MSSGIHPGAALAVSRIVADMRDNFGQVRTGAGTGFWLLDGKDEYFITNRHNVDPVLRFGAGTQYRLEMVRVLLRRNQGIDEWLPETEFAHVVNLEKSLHCHPTADVALLKNPEHASIFGHSNFTMEELATDDFFRNVLQPMDVASFLGYPGEGRSEWWDTFWNVAIARTVYISSWPAIPFQNPGIKTSDVILVNGLSFSGSSGSPVLSHRRPQPVGAPFGPPRILGIMSGHWWDNPDDYPMFRHSGLSYFTRATAIREVIAQAK